MGLNTLQSFLPSFKRFHGQIELEDINLEHNGKKAETLITV